MGFFSKLFGKQIEKEATDVLKSFTQAAVDAQKAQNAQGAQNVNTASSASVAPSPSYAAEEEGPSGFSWGPNMPAEENQYNFSGTYEEYFDSIFLKEYSQYRVEKEVVGYNKNLVYTFYSGDRKALVVEVIGRKSSPEKRRRECRATGVAYLRYYHNYHGWWNVKQYVIQRTNKALGI